MAIQIVGRGANEGITFQLTPCDTSHSTTLNGIPLPDSRAWMFSPRALLAFKDLSGLTDEDFQTIGVIRKLVEYIHPNLLRSRFRGFLEEGLRRVWDGGDHVNGRWLRDGWTDSTPMSDVFRVVDDSTSNRNRDFVLVQLAAPATPVSRDVYLYSFRSETYENRGGSYYILPDFRFSADSAYAPGLTRSSRQSISPTFDALPSFWKQKNNYSFRPEYEYLSLDHDLAHVFFGMELEVSTKLSTQELQYIVTEIEPKQRPFFYSKQDSSITGRYAENLVELVTMPCTPKYLKRSWRIFFDKLESLIPEGRSIEDYFDTATNLNNGLHIHIGNDAFIGFDTSRGRYNTHGSTSLHNNRFLTAFNQWTPDFQEWLQQISRRPSRPSDNEYCHVHHSFDGYTLARRIRRGADPRRTDRHAACHTNGVTTEVRVWQGIFNLKHIHSCIELTLAMLNFTMYGNSRLNSRTFVEDFTNYVEKQQGYTNAKEVLRSCV